MNAQDGVEFGDVCRCPGCGKVRFNSVTGLCAACLLRLGLDDTALPNADPDAVADDESATPPLLEDWLRIKSERIGNYELLDEIARGGMGIVYRARQSQPVRVVALKMMLPYLATSEPMRARFRIESDAVARLDHPGILPIYEVGEHNGLPYFSMKFAEGGSLARRMSTLAGQWREIAAIVAKLARAVQHAHESGILHRDLKPGNILFDARAEPMVADFGLAKFRAVDQNMTLPLAVLGSPNYIAPEQISSTMGAIGPATDVYSLGAILYELLTGRPPILGQDPVATLQMVSVAIPDSGVRSNPLIPRALDAISLRCLEKIPGRRYASAAALAEDLEHWLQGRPLAGGMHRRATGRRRMVAGVVILLFAFAYVAVDKFWMSKRIAQEKPVSAHGAEQKPLPAVAPTATGTPATQTGPAVVFAPPPHSIAVLPFVNMSGDAKQEYFSDGITEELLNALSRLNDLHVVARTSSFSFKGKDVDVSTIAHKLNVGA